MLPIDQAPSSGKDSSISHNATSGEEQKDWLTAGTLLNTFLTEGMDRNTLILNLGGGVINDLGGFVASVFKRGISFINIPTTLLAQIDAAYGGKTSINLQGVKNQAGTFQQPLTVYVNPAFLKTLPDKEWRSGIGELFKYSMIGANLDLRSCSRISSSDLPNQASIIEKCLLFKQGITQTDFSDKGIRSILNFGHTVGHALEAYAISMGIRLTHGEAVAAGVIAETYISCIMNNTSDSLLQKIKQFFTKQFFIDSKITEDPNALLQLMLLDKKNFSDRIMMVLLDKDGAPVLPVSIPKTIVIRSIEYLKSITRK